MVSKYFEKLLEKEFPSCNLEKISEEEKRKAILKNLKMIIPCAGNGKRISCNGRDIKRTNTGSF